MTRGDIRRFATAIGDPNPAYHDPAAAQALGHRDVVAPPTFLITLGFATAESLITDPELGLDYSLVVHGEQRFELHRPGRRRATVLDSRGARRRRSATPGATSCCRSSPRCSSGGERVATTTNTLVSRGTAAPRTTPRRGGLTCRPTTRSRSARRCRRSRSR